MRDSQKSKLYRAERSLSQFTEHEEMTLVEIEAYLNKLVRSAWFQRRWPNIQEARLFGDGRGRRSACGWKHGGTAYMTLPRWARNKPVVLHELAHSTSRHHGHGWAFAADYLTLITHELGEQAGKELRAAYKKNRVRYKKPRIKRPLSSAQLAALERGRAKLKEARYA